MLSQQENQERVNKAISCLLASSQKTIYVIIDGDRTLIPTDSTKFFFEYLNLDYNDIKGIFMQYGYSFEAFHNVAKYYSKIEKENYQLSCIESAKCVRIYPQFISFIEAIKDKVELILITSGIAESWRNVIKNHSLDFVHLIGGNYFPDDNFVIDKDAKGIITNSLRSANKKVFAFGDTMIDFEMLKEAHHSYLVVNEKMNKDFMPNSHEIPHLQQITFTDVSHSNLPISDFIQINHLIEKYYADSLK